MAEGIIAELNELLALRRYAQSVTYKPEGRALRRGNHLSKLRGRGMDFAEVRNYQAGDEIRHMEWRVTARTGRPHVKIYQEERERPVVILADFSPTMFFGTRTAFKSVIASRLAALLSWTAVKQGDRVGGLLFSSNGHEEFMPRGRETGILPMLSSLSHHTQQKISRYTIQPEALAKALLRLRRVTRPGSILILISDFYNINDECEKHLHRLRYHNDVLAYHICDPLELVSPIPEQYAISNGQEEILFDTRIHTIQEGYQKYCQQRISALQDLFKRKSIQYIQVTSDDNLPQLVRQTYPRRSHG
ncbi:DUF58 domain-containing protein [Legionella israelensis]|uniref:DUF58 domain-containing protein n=1 Tax=Legionella israelensis TaxID=454 RepID=A0AAX1EE44_9GAMM|nr:DUF58 domain-containing protein [Legionella israelensis]QBR83127.1 DUF58 domain-containing protein [Legionella israelensis]